MRSILLDCISIVKDLVGHDSLYFNEAVQIKNTPHSPPVMAWAVSVSESDELWLMDSEEQWHQVETSDINAALVIGSLYQRLMLMRVRYARAS